MDKFNYYLDAFKKYTKFDGRASLSQFWYFVLFNVVISILLGFISHSLSGLYGLAVLIPSLAIGSRRLHDINKSGWMQLVMLIPIIGIIWLIILFAKKGDVSANDFGEKALKTETIIKDDSEFGKKVNKITDKIEDVANKASDKIEDTVNDIKEKTNKDSNKKEE